MLVMVQKYFKNGRLNVCNFSSISEYDLKNKLAMINKTISRVAGIKKGKSLSEDELKMIEDHLKQLRSEKKDVLDKLGFEYSVELSVKQKLDNIMNDHKNNVIHIKSNKKKKKDSLEFTNEETKENETI